MAPGPGAPRPLAGPEPTACRPAAHGDRPAACRPPPVGPAPAATGLPPIARRDRRPPVVPALTACRPAARSPSWRSSRLACGSRLIAGGPAVHRDRPAGPPPTAFRPAAHRDRPTVPPPVGPAPAATGSPPTAYRPTARGPGARRDRSPPAVPALTACRPATRSPCPPPPQAGVISNRSMGWAAVGFTPSFQRPPRQTARGPAATGPLSPSVSVSSVGGVPAGVRRRPPRRRRPGRGGRACRG